MTLNFKRVVEDFVCEHCGSRVKGSGYTNHCPDCLWSKHVDNTPGDRSARCGGLMEPVGVTVGAKGNMIIHHCTLCREGKTNKASADDNHDIMLNIVKTANEGR